MASETSKMVRNTFCHIPGVGLHTEKRIWDAGIHSWDDALGLQGNSLPVGKKRVHGLRGVIDQSIGHLQARDPRYFAELLPSHQCWRLFPDFRDSVAYIDIETTGMGNGGDYITTIALYDGTSIFWYVHGQNLHDFRARIREYNVVVTYNGKSFDLPFIRSYLGIRMDQAHIDLRYVLSSLGYKGGLKNCEKQLGIDRQELEGVDGLFAVLLWDEYKRNRSSKALETLLAYNIQDVVSLETLMVLSYNLKLKQTPFHEDLAMASPTVPACPFKADTRTIDRIADRVFTGV
jgi:uncharacterized protein